MEIVDAAKLLLTYRTTKLIRPMGDGAHNMLAETWRWMRVDLASFLWACFFAWWTSWLSRLRKPKASSSKSLLPPDDFLDPISGDIMRDPAVVVQTGTTYERAFIERWFALGHWTDPCTKAPLESTDLCSNQRLKAKIDAWLQGREKRDVLLAEAPDGAIPIIAASRLTLRETLYEGPASTVLSGTLEPSSKPVAVKMFRARGLTELDTSKFRQELQMLYRVSLYCRNVCRLLGVCQKSGKLCMVMPLYPQSLESVLANATGGLPLDMLLLLASDICQAMIDLHAQSVLLLDLKPPNVLIDQYGRAVVADFGISAVRQSTVLRCMPSNTQGTPNYMAPEQWRLTEPGAEPLNPSVDLWAFGCVLLEMATGTQPWDGLTMFQIMKQVSGPNVTPPAVPPALHPGLRALLARCLQPHPDQRPSAEEVLDTLEELRRAVRPKPAGEVVRQVSSPRAVDAEPDPQLAHVLASVAALEVRLQASETQARAAQENAAKLSGELQQSQAKVSDLTRRMMELVPPTSDGAHDGQRAYDGPLGVSGSLSRSSSFSRLDAGASLDVQRRDGYGAMTDDQGLHPSHHHHQQPGGIVSPSPKPSPKPAARQPDRSAPPPLLSLSQAHDQAYNQAHGQAYNHQGQPVAILGASPRQSPRHAAGGGRDPSSMEALQRDSLTMQQQLQQESQRMAPMQQQQQQMLQPEPRKVSRQDTHNSQPAPDSHKQQQGGAAGSEPAHVRHRHPHRRDHKKEPSHEHPVAPPPPQAQVQGRPDKLRESKSFDSLSQAQAHSILVSSQEHAMAGASTARGGVIEVEGRIGRNGNVPSRGVPSSSSSFSGSSSLSGSVGSSMGGLGSVTSGGISGPLTAIRTLPVAIKVGTMAVDDSKLFLANETHLVVWDTALGDYVSALECRNARTAICDGICICVGDGSALWMADEEVIEALTPTGEVFKAWWGTPQALGPRQPAGKQMGAIAFGGGFFYTMLVASSQLGNAGGGASGGGNASLSSSSMAGLAVGPCVVWRVGPSALEPVSVIDTFKGACNLTGLASADGLLYASGTVPSRRGRGHRVDASNHRVNGKGDGGESNNGQPMQVLLVDHTKTSWFDVYDVTTRQHLTRATVEGPVVALLTAPGHALVCSVNSVGPVINIWSRERRSFLAQVQLEGTFVCANVDHGLLYVFHTGKASSPLGKKAIIPSSTSSAPVARSPGMLVLSTYCVAKGGVESRRLFGWTHAPSVMMVHGGNVYYQGAGGEVSPENAFSSTQLASDTHIKVVPVSKLPVMAAGS
eukprot:jgi/Mesvir1/22943/Mv19453-RA.1